jgi:hypothetical protein
MTKGQRNLKKNAKKAHTVRQIEVLTVVVTKHFVTAAFNELFSSQPTGFYTKPFRTRNLLLYTWTHLRGGG